MSWHKAPTFMHQTTAISNHTSKFSIIVMVNCPVATIEIYFKLHPCAWNTTHVDYTYNLWCHLIMRGAMYVGRQVSRLYMVHIDSQDYQLPMQNNPRSNWMWCIVSTCISHTSYKHAVITHGCWGSPRHNLRSNWLLYQPNIPVTMVLQEKQLGKSYIDIIWKAIEYHLVKHVFPPSYKHAGTTGRA